VTQTTTDLLPSSSARAASNGHETGPHDARPHAAPQADQAIAISMLSPRNGEARPRSSSRQVIVTALPEARRDAAKSTFTTRRVPPAAMQTVLSGALRPRSGDVVLAVIERIGHHTRVELPSGRKARVMAGDEIIVTYADRYAPDQFEAHVPAHLGPTELVASGGIASSVQSKSAAVRAATRIRPVGLIGDGDGRPINIADYALTPVAPPLARAPVIAVIGTSLNSGKTTTNTHLAHGLHLAGRRPGVAKVTGTGSGNDFWVQVDAGAHLMLDFTDTGYASTYRIPMRDVERIFGELVDHLAAANSGALLLEVADGIYQQETAKLIDSPVFRDTVDGVIFAAGEAMGAAQGVSHLRAMGLPVFAVSGRLTISPLATREAMVACGLPVLTLDQLHDPDHAVAILETPGAHEPAGSPANGVGTPLTNGHVPAPMSAAR
jgi:hypothetical protein